MSTTSIPPESVARIEHTTAALLKFGAAIAKAAQQAAIAFSTAFREVYRSQGAPYGDTEEGFLRWLHEVGEKVHKEAQQ